jgi:hypothetical protein
MRNTWNEQRATCKFSAMCRITALSSTTNLNDPVQKVPVLSSKTLTLWCVCPTVTSLQPYHPIAHPFQQFGTDIILAASSHSSATSACTSSSDSSFAVQGTFQPSSSRAILVVRCIHCQCWKGQQSIRILMEHRRSVEAT